MCSCFIAFCIKPCDLGGIQARAQASPRERVTDLPTAAVTKTFLKPEEELEASSIQFAVATRGVFILCESVELMRCPRPRHTPRRVGSLPW